MRRLVESYGAHPRQTVEWFLPSAPGAPLVVIVHGGFWRPVWQMDLEEPIAVDLAGHGFAVCSLEYRSYDNPWPATLADVATAIDHAFRRGAELGVDTTRAAILGHSAGGMLALWAVSRRSLPAGAPGTPATHSPFDLAILSAPVACLAQAWQESVGDGAVDQLMGGGPTEVSGRFAIADPAGLIPDAATEIVLMHGDADDEVPLSQSEGYLRHAQSLGAHARLIVLPGDGHYEILDPTSEASAIRRDLLGRLRTTP